MKVIKIIKLGSAALAMVGIALFVAIYIDNLMAAKQATVTPPRRPHRVSPPPPPAKTFVPAEVPTASAGQLLNIVIDPTTPVDELLPQPPEIAAKRTNHLVDELREVPEVAFQQPMSPKLHRETVTQEIAHQLARIRHVNQTKPDAFMAMLLDHRTDLQGMPFAMGDACHTASAKARYLASFSASTRANLSFSLRLRAHGKHADGRFDIRPAINAEVFWRSMASAFSDQETSLAAASDPSEYDGFQAGRVAAIMQILAPESAAVRVGLAQFLSKIPHIDATHALAKLALFSPEVEVQAAAINALKMRREQDYVPWLMQGFRYPLPEVAKRAADALVRLECGNMVPQLVELLDDPDPRVPANKDIDGQQVIQVSEIVRVNHHRNCMMCHAPAGLDDDEIENPLKKPPVSLVAQVPLPNQPLPSISDGGYYGIRSPDIMIRFDVTYLRQDFSMMMPVANPGPWAEMQRFDFLVRNRVLSAEEAEEYRQQAAKSVGQGPTPYQRAVLFALRELTQRDTEPTSKAWRELLGLPAKTGL